MAHDRQLVLPLQRSYAVSFSRARHALTAALSVLGVRPGQPVLVSPLNCQTVPLALLAKGWQPRYVDIQRYTLNLDPEAVRQELERGEVKACVFQATYGHTGGEGVVADLCAAHGVPLIVDAAHAFPTMWEGRSPGGRGKITIFSLDFGKPLPVGGGGFLALDDMGVAMRIKNARDRLPTTRTTFSQRIVAGIQRKHLTPRSYWRLFDLARRTSKSYGPFDLGRFKQREIDATVGQPSQHQVRWGDAGVKTLEERVRHALVCTADYSSQRFRAVPHIELPILDPSEPLHWFPVFTPRKEALLERARKRRVEIVPWPWKSPIYPLSRDEDLMALGLARGACPVAETVARELVGLPTHLKVDTGSRDRLLQVLQEVHAS
ncbi:MAG: DegT/DnrJ/EryC1/StrS aminotransferase family protein [Planctomycetes bacterium]|nr:DegT/DnrJ/EryC1/StrS aminotransferase family protein [Planctomycetota bacterium]